MSSKNDIYYAQLVANGDKDAFNFFVKEYQQMVFSVALTMVKDDSKAKDVVQNAFIKAYKRIGSFKGTSKFSTWLYRITINEALKMIRKEKRYIQKNDNRINENIEIGFNETALKIEIEEERLLINRVLKLMKPKEAIILKLFYLEEQSIKEIELLTGFKKGNIKVLLHRARKNFMNLYIKRK
ncbi:MAG: sigma-70 family RNA polymerase sigma factor [Flavobacteriaceae bacterium]|nr:sigma-70 family RNA polymerase sigma factor [Flavobacteriaceae bacterium]